MAKSGADYDDLFKSLITKHFPHYLQLFHPDLLPILKAEEAEWITQELRFPDFDRLADPERKPRRFADIAAKVPYLDPSNPAFEGTKYFVLDIEPQKGSVADLRPRMPVYRMGLKMAHPEAHVVVAGLYIDVGLAGLGIDWHLVGALEGIVEPAPAPSPTKSDPPKTENPEAFGWRYVGLPGLDAEDYLPLAEHNPLVPGLIGFMRIRPERRLEVLSKAILAIDGYELKVEEKNLLARGLLAGMDLSEDEERQFQEMIRQREELRRTGSVVKTWYDRGEDAGVTKGVRKIVLRQIAWRFGPSAQAQAEKLIAEMNEDQLQELAKSLVDPDATLEALGLAGGPSLVNGAAKA